MRIKAAKRAVIILLYSDDRVLMQLRDTKPEIDFPGKWGFFGGSIEKGETPKETAKRELMEEIGYSPSSISKLSIAQIPELGGLALYSFMCRLTVPVEALSLNEGLDFGLFSITEILKKKLFSKSQNKYYPVTDHPYIEYIIDRARKYIAKVNKDNMNIFYF